MGFEGSDWVLAMVSVTIVEICSLRGIQKRDWPLISTPTPIFIQSDSLDRFVALRELIISFRDGEVVLVSSLLGASVMGTSLVEFRYMFLLSMMWALAALLKRESGRSRYSTGSMLKVAAAL